MTFGEGMNFHSLLFEVLDLCSFREPRIPEARFPRIISVRLSEKGVLSNDWLL